MKRRHEFDERRGVPITIYRVGQFASDVSKGLGIKEELSVDGALGIISKMIFATKGLIIVSFENLREVGNSWKN